METLRGGENVCKIKKGNTNKRTAELWQGPNGGHRGWVWSSPSQYISMTFFSTPMTTGREWRKQIKMKPKGMNWPDKVYISSRSKEILQLKKDVSKVLNLEWKWVKGQARSNSVMKNKGERTNASRKLGNRWERERYGRLRCQGLRRPDVVSMSRIWALLIAGEMRIGSIHGNGCNGRDVEALKGGASTLPCFLIHPSILFWCPSSARTVSLHLRILCLELCASCTVGLSESVMGEWVEVCMDNQVIVRLVKLSWCRQYSSEGKYRAVWKRDWWSRPPVCAVMSSFREPFGKAESHFHITAFWVPLSWLNQLDSWPWLPAHSPYLSWLNFCSSLGNPLDLWRT